MDESSLETQLPEWAFVEVMGHTKIAGRLSPIKMGVAVMLQVDVLKADGSGTAYSKMYSPASLFSITPVTRDYCLRWSTEAEKYSHTPVPWSPPAAQIPERTTEVRPDLWDEDDDQYEEEEA